MYNEGGLQVGKGAVDDFLRDVTIALPRFRGLQVIVGRVEVEHSLSYDGTIPIEGTAGRQ